MADQAARPADTVVKCQACHAYTFDLIAEVCRSCGAVPLAPSETPGGMTWQEVKDFLDHIRVTCMDDRQMWKERARKAEAEVARLTPVVAAAEVVCREAESVHYMGRMECSVEAIHALRAAARIDGADAGGNSDD